MRKVCAECGSEWEARSSKAKYCADRCRVKAYERRKASPVEPQAAPAPVEMPVQPSAGTVEAATIAELERAGREETAVGQSAVALARRIDAGASEPGSSFAALVREHRGVLAEALKDAETAADPLDELRAKREQRLNAG